MRNRMQLISFIIVAGLLVVLMSGQPATAAEAGEPKAGTKENSGQLSAQELARQLNNPVSNVWSLTFQYNHSLLKGSPADGTEDQDLLNFQPALPLHMTENWNLIVRPVLPFIFKHPVLSPQIDPNTDEIYADFEDESGFGDISLITLLSPAKLKSRFLWGIGLPPSGSGWAKTGSWEYFRNNGGLLPETVTANVPTSPTSSISYGACCPVNGRLACRPTSR